MQARALAKAAAAAAILIIIALALGALLFGGRERGAPPPSPGPVPAVEPTAAPAVAALGSAAEPESAPAAADPETAPAPQNAAFELRGTLVVLDTDGVEHAEEDGEFVILRSTDGEEPLPVAVTAGKWQASWTAPLLPERIHVMGIKAGGAAARLDGPTEVSADAEVSIRARWEPVPLVVEVIGKDTGKGLDGIQVVATQRFSDDTTPHAGGFGPEKLLLESAQSPFGLERSPQASRWLQGKCKVWARAPGYAWGSTTIDFDKAGEYLIVLDRAAALEVVLVDPPSAREGEKAARIRVRSVHEKGCNGAVSADVAPAPGDSTSIEGLAPGSFTVCVELGNWFADPLVLGSAPVDLVAGETIRLTLRIEKRPDWETPVPLEGTIHIPSAWGVETISLAITPVRIPQLESDRLDASVQALPGRPGMHRWSAGKVPPGKYLVVMDPFQLQHLVEVPPQGKLDADIRIGDPVEARVKLIDAATGERARDATVSWACARPDESRGGTLEIADYVSETEENVFRAPAGRIEISIQSEQYLWVREALQLVPGQKPISIALHRSCGALITIEGSQRADRDELDGRIELKAVGGQGEVIIWRRHSDPLKLTIDPPGLYEVIVPKLDGFQAVEPARIRIPPGEFVEHTIVLQRE